MLSLGQLEKEEKKKKALMKSRVKLSPSLLFLFVFRGDLPKDFYFFFALSYFHLVPNSPNLEPIHRLAKPLNLKNPKTLNPA